MMGLDRAMGDPSEHNVPGIFWRIVHINRGIFVQKQCHETSHHGRL